MGEYSEIINAISTVGFPIVCCFVLFKQNSKLSDTIASLKETLVENTTLLKLVTDKFKKED